MLRHTTIAAGSGAGGKALAEYLLDSLAEDRAALARYYNRGMQPEAAGVNVAEPRRDLHPAMAELLGLDPHRAVTAEELGHIFAGQRADGQDIARRQRQKATVSLADALGLDPSRPPTADEVRHVLAGKRVDGEAVTGPGTSTARQRFLTLMGVTVAALDADQARNLVAGLRADGTAFDKGVYRLAVEHSKPRIAAVDLTFSASREVSIAWALAPTEAERAIIHTAHRDAVAETMKVIAADLGHARKGKGGRGGTEPAHMGWFTFDHFAARPVVDIARVDEQGTPYTSRHEIGAVGDMAVHSHVLVPSVLLTEGGRVASLDLDQLGGRVHYYGAIYQAHLATNLRRAGADATLDPDTGAATLESVPRNVTKAFSKRSQDGTESARTYAKGKGLDWDAMMPEQRVGLVHSSTQARRRSKGQSTSAPENRAADFGAWQAQARGMGYQHRTVLGHEPPALSRDERLELAYQTSLKLLERELGNSAALDGMKLREIAARGLITAGVENAVADIDRLTREMRERGVKQDGQDTALVWGEVAAVRGKARVGVTTELHETREQEVVRLVREAATDRSGALSHEAVARAVERSGFDFTSEHGQQQRAAVDALGSEGRVALFQGAAGAGKSAVLRPLVDAWREDGRTVYGAALGWHQTDSLEDAGISGQYRAALDPFIAAAREGRIQLDRRSVVILEEVGRVGSKQLGDVMRLQAEYGFSVVAIGDPKQLQPIQSGDAIDLLRRGLGAQAGPEIATTLRQRDATERETTGLFREGRAAEAIRRKVEDGTAKLVPGDRQAVLDRVAELWRDRTEKGAEVTVSAPTNADARDVALAIRTQRRDMGQVGEDLVQVDTTSRRKTNSAAGDDYTMPLAIGDRVRLYERAGARFSDGRRGVVGSNGSILEVRGIGAEGLTLRNAKGSEGLVKWDTLRDEGTGRIRLGWGDALTVDAAQGSTVGTHILAAPSGSASVDGYRGYTAGSRHRDETVFVFSEAAERREVTRRRPRGGYRPITAADLWENVSRNLARQPERAAALAFLERAENVRRGTVRDFQATLQPSQQLEHEGRPPAPQKGAGHITRAQAQAGAQASRHQARDRAAQVTQRAILAQLRATTRGKLAHAQDAVMKAATYPLQQAQEKFSLAVQRARSALDQLPATTRAALGQAQHGIRLSADNARERFVQASKRARVALDQLPSRGRGGLAQADASMRMSGGPKLDQVRERVVMKAEQARAEAELRTAQAQATPQAAPKRRRSAKM